MITKEVLKIFIFQIAVSTCTLKKYPECARVVTVSTDNN